MPDRDKTDSSSLTDFNIVDEPGLPTIHHVRVEVAESRVVTMVLEERGRIRKGQGGWN